MVRAWVALAAGNRAGEVFSSSRMTGTPRRPSSMASVSPQGPPPMMTTAQSCLSLTEFPGCMIRRYNSDRDDLRNVIMNPTVAVVAQGAMGAGVGGRLVERGLAGGHVARRPQRGQRQAGQGRRHGRGVRPGAGARRLFPLDPAAERRAGAGRENGGADRAEQPQADLCRLQRGEPADQDRDRPRHHQGGIAVRRRRHHRRRRRRRATTGRASMRPAPTPGVSPRSPISGWWSM